jgi:hypothetical protein
LFEPICGLNNFEAWLIDCEHRKDALEAQASQRVVGVRLWSVGTIAGSDSGYSMALI